MEKQMPIVCSNCYATLLQSSGAARELLTAFLSFKPVSPEGDNREGNNLSDTFYLLLFFLFSPLNVWWQHCKQLYSTQLVGSALLKCSTNVAHGCQMMFSSSSFSKLTSMRKQCLFLKPQTHISISGYPQYSFCQLRTFACSTSLVTLSPMFLSGSYGVHHVLPLRVGPGK